MQKGRNPALERFMATIDGLADDKVKPSMASMIGGVHVERGHVIVLGNVTPEAIGLLLGAGSGTEPGTVSSK